PYGHNLSVYVQDDWKVSQRLTVSYGVRYDIRPPWSDKSNQLGNFDRDFPGGRVVVSDRQELEQIPALVRQTTPNTPFVTADEAGLPRALRKPDYPQIRPRVGFAYRLGNDNRSVVRGHFGIYTTPLLGGVNYSLAGVVTSYVPAYVNRALGNGRFALQYPN